MSATAAQNGSKQQIPKRPNATKAEVINRYGLDAELKRAMESARPMFRVPEACAPV